MFVITPEIGTGLRREFAGRQVPGIGPATAARMSRLGIHTGADLKAQPLARLQEQFGKAGSYYFSISRGIDDRPVRPNRIRKSVGAENTFERDLWTFDELGAELQPLIDKVWGFCEQSGVRGRTVTLKVKFQDFEQITRSRSFSAWVDGRAAVETATLELLSSLSPMAKGVRLLGITLSSLNTQEEAEARQFSFALPT